MTEQYSIMGLYIFFIHLYSEVKNEIQYLGSVKNGKENKHKCAYISDTQIKIPWLYTQQWELQIKWYLHFYL